MSESSSERNPVEELAEQFLARCRQGERPALSEYTERYPELADQIRRLFPLLTEMEAARAARPAGPSPELGVLVSGDHKLERLGDYQVLREVGRGGMGIVYEAVQLSLGRHVALKVLPRHALLDPRHLQRFQREAKAAARLHHSNIVPVYSVGEENGLHYYAMQFIQGLGLDEVLAELRRRRRPKAAPEADGNTLHVDVKDAKGVSSVEVAKSLLSGRFSSGACNDRRQTPAGKASGSAVSQEVDVSRAPGVHSPESDPSIRLPGQSADSTLTDSGTPYCQSVARIGVQVAEALAYASSQGILHRDIKPSNLLIDAQETVWVTDFGLAKAAGSEDLTHSGDIVGTLRYMAPERFAGQCDARSDLYALGLTLYELMTLRPAFQESDPNMLLQQVLHDEPPRPRKVDRHIPRDLETILLKAIDKQPARRYATGLEVADDLRRFLADRPVRARPVSVVERLWRWSRRNPVVAGLSATVLLLLFVVAIVASVGYVQTTLALNRERRLNYAATMGLVQQAWENHNILRFHELLAETGAFPERGFEWYYWQRLCRVEHLRLVGHKGGLTAVAFSPNGQRLVTGGGDSMARVWDADSGRELLCLAGHRRQVTAVAFGPDGQWLVTGSMDGTAKIWDASSGRELRTLQGQNTGSVWAVAVTPDKKRVVTGSDDGTARVWDAASGQELLTLKGPTALPVLAASMAGLVSSPPDQGLFLAVSALYRGRTGHTGPIWAVAATADGRLVTGSQDQTARIWDADNARQLLPPLDHTVGVSSVAVSRDGHRIITGGGGSLKLWDAASSRELPNFATTSEIYSVTLTPDGKRAVTGSSDGLASVWDTASDREILTLRGHENYRWANCLAVSPDGERLATASLDGTARVWDLASGRGTPTFKRHGGAVLAVTVTVNGPLIITRGEGADDRTVRIWDALSSRELLKLEGHSAVVSSAAVTPDGQRIITGGVDGVVRLWDAVSGRKLLELDAHTERLFSVAVTPDGQRIVTGGEAEDGTAKLWDANSGHELRTLRVHTGQVSCISVTPDGQRLVTGEWDGRVRFWDADVGQELLALKVPGGAILSVAVIPDTERLVTGSMDGTVRLWDTNSRRELLKLEGHTRRVRSVTVTPDGQRIVTGGEDGTARLWDAVSGRELLTLKGHTKAVHSIAVTSDGRRVITASEDGTVKIWEAASREQVDIWASQEREAAQRVEPWHRPDAAAQGFIQEWLVLAPVPLKVGQRGANGLEIEQISGEAGLQPRARNSVPVDGQEYTWKAHRAEGPVLDFNRFVGQRTDNAVAYAVCYVVSPAARNDLLLQVGSDDEAKVYLNGQEVYKHSRVRPLALLDSVGPVTLRKGTNVLVLKVVNDYLDWECCARFVDRDGNPAEGLRFSTTPEN